MLYVTAHYAMPTGDVEGARPGSMDSIYWVSWRSLWDVLERAKQAGYPGYRPGERRLLGDVQEMLLRRGLAGFVNPLHHLSPVERYERRIFSLGRALTPVGRYTPLLTLRSGRPPVSDGAAAARPVERHHDRAWGTPSL